MAHRILALDLGSFSALAYPVPGGPPYVTSCKFNAGRETTAATLGRVKMERPEIIACFWNWLGTHLRSAKGGGMPFDTIIYERPFARGQAATRMLWGMAGVVEALAHANGAAVLDATPGEIKKWSTGQGSAEKTTMIDAAGFMGYRGDNEHEADAWCLLRFAEATLTQGSSDDR